MFLWLWNAGQDGHDGRYAGLGTTWVYYVLSQSSCLIYGCCDKLALRIKKQILFVSSYALKNPWSPNLCNWINVLFPDSVPRLPVVLIPSLVP